MRLALIAGALIAVVVGAPARAQSMPGMTMPDMGGAAKAEPPVVSAPPPLAAPPLSSPPAPPPSAPADPMAGMDMGGMDHAAPSALKDGEVIVACMRMPMTGALGLERMTQDGSGTSWQPASSPHQGLHLMRGGWSVMLHGDGTLVYDDQGGPRGQSKTFFESMLMGMASRPLGGGELTLHGMVSLDPLMGKAGYPLLLQTGETADGAHPLIDRQHPHDLIDELSVTYAHPLAQTGAGAVSGFVYAGYPGEPALGPVTYMHRFSGIESPEAPIDHHWLDSTHVTFGVVTAGVTLGDRLKLEASAFRGREPDQHRYDFDKPSLDSGSVRLTWNPTRDLSMQVSQGWLHSPEQLEPGVNQRRTTASATYNRAYTGGNWQTTLAWGEDVNRPGKRLDAVLVESAASYGPHTVFARAERANKDELFDTGPLVGRAFEVGKLSVGYAYSIPVAAHFLVDVGGLISAYDLPSALEQAYGSNPRSIMLFTRVKLR